MRRTLIRHRPLRAPHPRAAIPALALAAALALTGCASGNETTQGGTSTPSASASPTAPFGNAPSAHPVIDAVQEAVGGEWTAPSELPHSVCQVGGGEGLQSVVTSTSQERHSGGGARDAAERAGEALAASGFTPGEVAEADGVASVDATAADGASVTVTIEAQQSRIELRSPCSGENEPY